MKLRKDYLHPSLYPSDYREKLQYIKDKICMQLKNYHDFDGLDFIDVSGYGISVRGFHKEIQGYSYIDIILKRDFSNVEEVINTFVEQWIATDTLEIVMGYKSFIKEGEKYGWD